MNYLPADHPQMLAHANKIVILQIEAENKAARVQQCTSAYLEKLEDPLDLDDWRILLVMWAIAIVAVVLAVGS